MVETQIVTMTKVTCYKCGVPFSMPEHLSKKKRQHGETFWCPNGHSQWWGESTVDKLERKLKQMKSSRDYWERASSEERADHEHTRNRLRATKAAHTRTKNRIHKGVCPHCNRHFEDLQRHMETKHPDKAEESTG